VREELQDIEKLADENGRYLIYPDKKVRNEWIETNA
jgi:hypothetical protein